MLADALRRTLSTCPGSYNAPSIDGEYNEWSRHDLAQDAMTSEGPAETERGSRSNPLPGCGPMAIKGSPVREWHVASLLPRPVAPTPFRSRRFDRA
jgi:hypothetical protein